MLPLVRTLFDIVLLRKGPERIPRSWLLVGIALCMTVYAALAAVVLIDRIEEETLIPVLFNVFVGSGLYAAVVVLAGFAGRLPQTLTALLGCWGLIQIAFVAEFVLFMPLLGERLTLIVGDLIRLWSIPVEGHIIARAIDRHWYVGILIAIGIFTLQYILYMVTAAES